jgi:hypothetical protein
MKIDFSGQITNLANQPVKDEAEKPLTLGSVAIAALLNNMPGDDALSAEKKVTLAVIAQQVHNAEGEVSLSVEDVALVKERIGKAYGPLVVMKAYQLIDAE